MQADHRNSHVRGASWTALSRIVTQLAQLALVLIAVRTPLLPKAVTHSPVRSSALKQVLDHIRHQTTRQPWFSPNARGKIAEMDA